VGIIAFGGAEFAAFACLREGLFVKKKNLPLRRRKAAKETAKTD